jgi:PEP-CTERM motif
LVGILVLGAAPSAAVAAPLLSDNFNGDPEGLNWPGDAVFTSTQASGQVGTASVDLVGPGFFSLCAPGQGNCVDLDGSSGNGNNPSGQLTSNSSFGPGSYTLTFDLAGNERSPTPQTTSISLGTFSTALPLGESSPWTTYSYTFTTATGGSLQFTDSGPSDQQGNLLDNVTLVAVPEPATWAMMLLGLAGVGAMMRGRNRRLVDAAVI